MDVKAIKEVLEVAKRLDDKGLCNAFEGNVVPYGRPGSDDIYKGADKIFQKGRDICLLANHGVLAVGETVYDAMNKLESVENACRICTISKLVGEPSNLPEEEVKTLLSL